MKIERVINNNTIVSRDSNGREIIATGRGIGFRASPGVQVEETLIDGVYTFLDPATMSRAETLMMDISPIYVHLTDKMMIYIKSVMKQTLSEELYLSLLDHVSSALQRYVKNIKLKNPMLWELKRFYREEYNVATELLDIIRQETGVEMEEDEAGFLTVHLVNAEIENRPDDTLNVTSIIQKILSLVQYRFGITYDEESVSFYRFVTHLRFFAQRLLYHQLEESSDSGDLLELITAKYPREYECAVAITTLVEKDFNHTVSDDEKVYLTIHISRVTRESQHQEGK